MKIAFTTLGCRTNQHDSSEMQTLLEQEGFSIVSNGEEADVYVVNTCTVTQKSDYNSRLAVKKSLAINENALVVFTGCYAQTRPDEAMDIPGMDLVLGNADKLEIATVLKQRLDLAGGGRKNGAPQLHMSDINSRREFKTIPVSRFQGRTKAFIKVQTGCGERCSFCTVVRARGRSISDSRENILHNVRQAIAAGFKEITLSGINLGTYGMDSSPPETFSSLVADILKLKGDFRVRLSSINPMEIDDDLLQLIANSENLCPHLHIPLQSGDDAILSRMRRNYNSGQYVNVVERAVSRIPDLGLGADVIVGFPGETDAMFENTRRMIDDLPFSYLHVFTYSPRKGTEAFDFQDEIPKAVKKSRNKILTELANNKALEFRKRFLNRTVSVLLENQRDASSGMLKGHSDQYIPVAVPGDDRLMNRIVPVTIQEVSEHQVSGCVQS